MSYTAPNFSQEFQDGSYKQNLQGFIEETKNGDDYDWGNCTDPPSFGDTSSFSIYNGYESVYDCGILNQTYSNQIVPEKCGQDTVSSTCSDSQHFLTADDMHNYPIYSNLAQSGYGFPMSLPPLDSNFEKDSFPLERWSTGHHETRNLFEYSEKQNFLTNEKKLPEEPYSQSLQMAHSPVEVIDLTHSPNKNHDLYDIGCVSSDAEGDHSNTEDCPSQSVVLTETTTSNEMTPLHLPDSMHTNQFVSTSLDYFSGFDVDNGLNHDKNFMQFPPNTTTNFLNKSITNSILHDHEQNNRSKKLLLCVELANRELWRKFFEIGTEMIITKAGRRMFPAIKLEIRGMSLQTNYIMAVDIVPIDNNRYRYVYHNSQWMAAGTTDSHPPPRIYIHPDSPCRGEIWMRQPIIFDKLKLTNYEANKKGHIILNSMHKYQPRVHIIECHSNHPTNMTQMIPKNKRIEEIPLNRTTVAFPECVFTTVTAYQNQQITKLKIDRNPFAKGFRETNKQWQEKISEKTSAVSSHSVMVTPNALETDINPMISTNTTSVPLQIDDDAESWDICDQSSLSQRDLMNNQPFGDIPVSQPFLEVSNCQCENGYTALTTTGCLDFMTKSKCDSSCEHSAYGELSQESNHIFDCVRTTSQQCNQNEELEEEFE